jgi:hypothetical protein
MRRNQFQVKNFISEKENIKINLTIKAAPANTVGARSSLRQVKNMLEICEIPHKNNFDTP